MNENLITNLTDYDIDPRRGFLPAQDPLERLPEAFDRWEQIAADLPALLMTGRLRFTLEQLPPLDATQLKNEQQVQRAMLLLSVFGNSYVWGSATPATVIPRGVAIPWAQVAEQLGRPMIVAHASMVLNNWRRLDKSQPVALDNLDTLQLFLGGLDEKWFFLTTVAIEAEGAPALPALVEAQRAAAAGQPDRVAGCLETINTTLNNIFEILRRVPEKCDPYIFYHRIRPFLAGWEAPGIIYQGVSESPQILAGGSAAQSSLIQALDAGLGIAHIDDKTRPFLMEMRHYMPPSHRRFIEALEAGPSIRQFVAKHQGDHPGLVTLYNEAIERMSRFRTKHIEISVRYILRQAPKNEEAKGTGGTDFVPFLHTARQETQNRKIA